MKTLPPTFFLSILPLTHVTTAAPPDPPECDCYLVPSSSDDLYFLNHAFFDFRSLSTFTTSSSPPKVPSTRQAAISASETSPYFLTPHWRHFWSLQSWDNGGINPYGGANYVLQNTLSNVYIETDPSPDISSYFSDAELEARRNPDDAPPSSSPQYGSEEEQQEETYLVLRTAKLPEFQTGAEFESRSQGYHHVSMRMRARTLGAPGACTAMFTFREPSSTASSSTLSSRYPPQYGPSLPPSRDLTTRDAGGAFAAQESDIEFLTTHPPTYIQLTNQPSLTPTGRSIADSTLNLTLPASKTFSQWTTYRFDWSPGLTAWSIDDIPFAELTIQVPRDPARLIINAWGDGGKWTGEMQDGDEAVMQIQWIEVVYNTTEPRGDEKMKFRKRDDGEESCAKVCSIDGTGLTGRPVLLHDNMAAGTLGVARTGLFVTVLAAGLALSGLW